MQKVDEIEQVKNPLEDRSSQFEEPSTQVSAQILVPLIADDVYSISDLFSEFHTEDIMHASQESHAETFVCAMHASQEQHASTMHASRETKRGSRTSDSILIFSEKNLQKMIGYLNSSQKNTQFQKQNHSKWSSGGEVMIILKSTKF